MDVKVKFLGGTGTVTGSKYLLTIGDFSVLFDCGLFQGLKELRLRNWDRFPVDASSIDAVIISHAHIDHTGYLPKLVKEGFHGPIYCTEPTADLMQIMLLDSAKLQEEEAAYANAKGYSKHPVAAPLYTTPDAQAVFPLVRRLGYGKRTAIHENVEMEYSDAGHLLGSAITQIFVIGKSQTKTLVFSGDLGRSSDPMLRAPARITNADVLFIESTYGNKDNPVHDPSKELEDIVNETLERNGVLLIPAFAVGRTQMLLYFLHHLMSENKIPDVPVYIDSPMAISATYLYYRYPSYHKVLFNQGMFAHEMETNMLVFVKNSDHSKTLNAIKKRAIIISSSGMMSGGRILHHMYHRLRNHNDTILISGYQAIGTRGHDLEEGAPSIKIFGEEVPVHCRVAKMTSLSGHADRSELFAWMRNFTAAPKLTFTVHGEGNDLTAYANAIRSELNWNVVQPSYLQTVSLFEGI
jgi:metallo-beta-lactamase family protein